MSANTTPNMENSFRTTTNHKSDIVSMFLDATEGESYARNRLVTARGESGAVGLIAYGERLLARIFERGDDFVVEIFDDNRESTGRAVRDTLNRIKAEAESRERTVVQTGGSPFLAVPNAQSAQYIDHYVNFLSGMSPVEKDAYDDVEESLKDLTFSRKF